MCRRVTITVYFAMYPLFQTVILFIRHLLTALKVRLSELMKICTFGSRQPLVNKKSFLGEQIQLYLAPVANNDKNTLKDFLSIFRPVPAKVFPDIHQVGFFL